MDTRQPCKTGPHHNINHLLCGSTVFRLHISYLVASSSTSLLTPPVPLGVSHMTCVQQCAHTNPHPVPPHPPQTVSHVSLTIKQYNGEAVLWDSCRCAPPRCHLTQPTTPIILHRGLILSHGQSITYPATVPNASSSTGPTTRRRARCSVRPCVALPLTHPAPSPHRRAQLQPCSPKAPRQAPPSRTRLDSVPVPPLLLSARGA